MRRRLILAAALAAMLPARPLAAQASADTVGLPRAVATVLRDSVIQRLGTFRYRRWNYAGTALDSAVARTLAADRLLYSPQRWPRRVLTLTVESAQIQGDSAHVTVLSDQHHERTGPLTSYLEWTDYVFARSPLGWKFVRSKRLRSADAGSVRG